MAVRKIESSDTLELGFRGKYNETIEQIPVSGLLTSDGKLRLTKFGGGGFFEIPLLGLFYTKDEILQMLQGGSNVPVATETNRGIIQIASQEEIDLGDDDQKAVTAAKLKNSELISWKGIWVQPGADEAYPANVTVIRGNGIYLSLVADNQSDPSADPTKWRNLSSAQSSPTKTTIDVTDTAILINNWQTTIVPGTTTTYVEAFGNVVFKALVSSDDGSGFFTTYEANIRYTKDEQDRIVQMAVEDILFPGKLTFI